MEGDNRFFILDGYKFTCPSCSKSMRVDDQHAGKKGKCPKCGQVLVVPERSTLIEFDCEGCGFTIKVADSYAGKKGRCPKCRNPVVVPAAQEAVFESEAPQAPDVDDNDYGEDTPYEDSTEPDRRLVLIIAGGATVVVAVIIALALMLWPSDSKPAAPLNSQETTDTESQRTPVVSNAPTPEQTGTPEATDATHLLFNPSPGTRHTMRTTTQLVMSGLQNGQLQERTSTQSITVDLQAEETTAEDTIPVKVIITQIQVKAEVQGNLMDQYDSAVPSSDHNPLTEYYSPFVGKDLTIHISRQGDIVNAELDELYLVAAQDRIQAENDLIRTQNGETADAVISRIDQHFGSRDRRILALKKQLEQFPIFGHEQIRQLLEDLIVSLPSEPVKHNMTWNGSITVKAEMNENVPATYSVTSLDENTCVIEAQGKRSEEEPPFVYQTGQTTITSDLAGSSQVTLLVDRRTGWLKS